MCSIAGTSQTAYKEQKYSVILHITTKKKKQRSEILPPTLDALTQLIKRTNYQAYVWKNALTAMQQLQLPEGNGWYIGGIIETCPDDQGPSTKKTS